MCQSAGALSLILSVVFPLAVATKVSHSVPRYCKGEIPIAPHPHVSCFKIMVYGRSIFLY